MKIIVKKEILVLSLVFLISCTDNKKDLAKKIESVEIKIVEKTNINRVEIEDKQLRYKDVDKKLNNLDDLFDMYSVTELKSIKKLLVSHSNISKINSLNRVPNLTHLSLTNTKISKIENLDVLEKLEGLSLSANNIEVIENLGNLPNLEQFNISDNPLKNLDGLLELRGMTHISTFSTISKTNEYYSNEEFSKLFNQVLENNKETLKLDNFNI